MVQIRGAAEGFATGWQLAEQQRENQLRYDLLRREQQQEKAKVVASRIEATLEGLKNQVGAAPQRNEALNTAIEQQKAQMMDVVNALQKTDPDTASYLSNLINSTIPAMRTKSEQFSNEQLGKFEGAKMAAQTLVGGGQNPAPPAAGAPAAPMPGSNPMPGGNLGAELPGGAAPAPIGAQAPVAPAPQVPAQTAQAGKPGTYGGMTEEQLILNMLGIKPQLSAYDEQFQKKKADDDVKFVSKAKDAVGFLKANIVAQDLLDQGMFTGFMASAKKDVAKAVGAYDQEVANTEAFSANRIMASMRLLQEMGAGTGLSDADREAATLAAGGNIDTSEAGLRDILAIERDMIRELIARNNERFPNEGIEIPGFDMRPERPGNTFGMGGGGGGSGLSPEALKPDADGRITLPNGVKIRQVR